MNNNQKDNQKDNQVQDSYKKLPIFKDSSFTFIYSKTEKIVTAIYMITNFFTTEEPLKWQLRTQTLKLLNSTMSLSRSTMSGRNLTLREVTSHLFETKSLFNIAYNSGFISQMNFDILNAELNNLVNFLTEYDQGHLSIESELYNKTFFETHSDEYSGKNFQGHVKDSIKDNLKDINKNTQSQFTLGHYKKINSENVILKKDNKIYNSSYGRNINDSKIHDDRRKQILELIKDKKEVTVKDISIVIQSVSDKTLQRELISMVKEGIIKKEGERRWSKYSLN